MKKIGVLTSGGDAPGMNAAIRAVVRCGIDRGMTVYGIRRGYEGLIDRDIVHLERRDVGGILHRGGTFLGTARSARFMTEEGQDKAVENLKELGIEGVVVIGGNGSLKGSRDLVSRGIKVVGVPGTIDNDLGYSDETIGFDTAVNTVLDAISKLRDTSSAHDRSTVVEVMGRKCGDIALLSGLAGGAEYVVMPDEGTECLEKIKAKVMDGASKKKRHSIIIRAEGAAVTNEEIAKALEEATGKETRIVVLSYLQRGGSPTAKDRILATLTGAKAVELLDRESCGSMAVGIHANSIIEYPLDVALDIELLENRNLLELIDVLSK